MNESTYPLGKLPAEKLSELLSRYGADDDRVIIGPGIGHDAAVISFGDRYLVAKTDPITFATDEIGWYAVHVNANDVVCTGARPRWFLPTLLLPEKRTGPSLVEDVFAQMARVCDELGISLVGGHTEITHGIDRPILIGNMLGEVAPDRLVRPDGATPGDALLLTKGIAVEGTAIIAREKADALSDLEDDLLERSRDFLHDPGISVVKEARIAVEAGDVHAMHDPTEGGLATGLWEMADASEVGIEVYEEDLPILPETTALCRPLGLDPMGLIASGALLLAVAPEDADVIIESLEDADIKVFHIGRVTDSGCGVILVSDSGERPLPRFDQDEIARLF